MTAAAAELLDDVTRRRIAGLAALDDVELGVRLLRGVPTNETRSGEELAQHSRRAQAYGSALAEHRGPSGSAPVVVERADGMREQVIARYDSRDHRVDLYLDTVAFCEALIEEMGWQHWYPAGTVRQAAIDHEHAHHLVTRDHAAGLRRALDHDAFRIGRWRRLAFIAGTDEVAAHAYASSTAGVGRSFLLLTAAAAAALPAQPRVPRRPTPSEN